jgi:hypothetical protein
MLLLTRLHRPGVRLLPTGLFSALLLQGCASSSVVSRYDCDTIVNNPNTRRTTWTYAWGLVQPKDIEPRCESGHLNRVTVKTNPGFILLSVISLGIVVPQQLEWCCAPHEPAPALIGN